MHTYISYIHIIHTYMHILHILHIIHMAPRHRPQSPSPKLQAPGPRLHPRPKSSILNPGIARPKSPGPIPRNTQEGSIISHVMSDRNLISHILYLISHIAYLMFHFSWKYLIHLISHVSYFISHILCPYSHMKDERRSEVGGRGGIP